MLKFRYAVLPALLLMLVACGGGGGGSPTVPSNPVTPAPSVSGDMLAVSQNKGWNYQGSTASAGPITFTLYADPASNGITPLVLLGVLGTQADATAGTKQAAMTITPSANGYDVTSYTIYNGDGSIYANGALPSGSLLVPSTLTQGQSFTPYTGMSATVTFVGGVPGAAGCPAQASGATVQYTFQGQTYKVSYVPGCGITQYVGNHGETFTLTSVGTYQLGTLGDVRKMRSLTLLDSLRSLWHVVTSGVQLHNVLHP